MSKRTVVSIVLGDDLDAASGIDTQADGTVTLAFIDSSGQVAQVGLELTKDHEADLAAALAPYLAAGHTPEVPLVVPRAARAARAARAVKGPDYKLRGRATPASRRVAAYAALVGHDIWHRADGQPYSGGKPYMGPSLQAACAAYVATPEGEAWLAGLSVADGGEAP